MGEIQWPLLHYGDKKKLLLRKYDNTNERIRSFAIKGCIQVAPLCVIGCTEMWGDAV